MSPPKWLLFSLLPTLVLVSGAELVVRQTGAGDRCYARVFEKSELLECDPLLQFRMKHDLVVDGAPLNSLGFRDREFTRKHNDVYRIITLGDSCTFGLAARGPEGARYVATPYPRRLEQLAAEQADRRVEVLNAGVCGYNTFHGIMLLRTKLRGLRPDLVTVRFGWNDLFASTGVAVEAYREPTRALVRDIEDLLLRTALYGYTRRLAMALHPAPDPSAITATTASRIGWHPNVPVDVYAMHLRRMVELAGRAGARVWLLTSPDAFTTDEYRGRYSDLAATARTQLDGMRLSGIRSFSDLVRLHAAYNAATRAVASELGIPLVDVEQAYRAHADEHLFEPTDVIHPNQLGHDIEADALYRELVALESSPSSRYPTQATPSERSIVSAGSVLGE